MDYAVLSRLSAAKPAPNDWTLIVADIRGSTGAVKEGRYRDVNLIGAACIATVRNSFPSQAIPYVFGGDGATFLLPPEHRDQCLKVLEGVKTLARVSFSMNLMIGHMLVREIRADGHDVRYGFLSWSAGEKLPFFRGDGIRYAETVLKSKQSPELVKESDEDFAADLTGLSCRLMPFQSSRGRVVSVVVEVTAQGEAEDKLLSTILHHLRSKGPIERLRPVSLLNEKRPWLSSTWKSEAKLHGSVPGKGRFAVCKTLFESFLATFLFRTNIRNPILGLPSEYTQFMLEQTDWIKMDGSLRLVLDMTSTEESSFIELLKKLESDQQIRFGHHLSDGTVMTCHFQSVEGQRHAHFIDGSGGGLTHAAHALKSKVALQSSILDDASALRPA